MKTIDIEIALMHYFGIRQNIIVPNISWGVGNLHECDLLKLTLHGYATEIEIKINKADLLKDKQKKHNHESDYIKSFYFAVPEKLKDIALTEIPERAGLIIVKDGFQDHLYGLWRYVEIVKECIDNKNCKKWEQYEICQLAKLGAMRILGLKKKIWKLNNKPSKGK